MRTDRMTPARAPDEVQIADGRAPERAGDGLSQVTEPTQTSPSPLGRRGASTDQVELSDRDALTGVRSET
jgi:hypothetical protein